MSLRLLPSARVARPILIALMAALLVTTLTRRAVAVESETLESVVSVLPVWPGRAQAGAGAPPGVAPEGSGVVVDGAGFIATAWHVVEPAERIDVRLSDGRILPARLVGRDAASDIALLRVDAALRPFERAPRPSLADPVCALGNAYGLGVSVTCGVVSALDVSEAGFNPVEDFVQTDAAANPGVSGGALVDAEGRLVGMVSAIFSSRGETNIGVNFAVSAPLLSRVVGALRETGAVSYPAPGWRLERLSPALRAETAGAAVAALEAGGPAEAAGVEIGDVLLRLGDRRILKPRDAIAALAVLPSSAGSVAARVLRDGRERALTIVFETTTGAPAAEPGVVEAPLGDCPHPAPVCLARQAVFPVSSFDPLGSATRIGPSLLVTNRHVVGDRSDAVVYTPDGPRGATVVASAYRGDLALLEVDGLPEEGLRFSLEGAAAEAEGRYFAVGADIARQEVRVFDPGGFLLPPADGAALGRLHVSAPMQPGVSGGALVDEAGRLVGVAVGGGEGRFEAIPLHDVRMTLALRDDAEADAVQRALGDAMARCAQAIDAAQGVDAAPGLLDVIPESCAAADNQGQLLEAGRVLGAAGAFAAAIEMHRLAAEQTPNSVNARLSYLVSLQLGGRFEEMLPHARWLMDVAPGDPQALRFAIQSGVWGGDAALAEAAYEALVTANPRQAEAARRFIDNAPPPPPRR